MSKERASESSKTDPLDRLEEYYQNTLLNTFKETIHMLNRIIRCTDGRLDLRRYAYRSSKAVSLVENYPQLAENKDSEEFHYTVEDPPANGLSIPHATDPFP